MLGSHGIVVKCRAGIFFSRRLELKCRNHFLQAQLDELVAAYKKANKVELADEIDKKCEGDTKTLILAKLGRGQLIFILKNKYS